MLSRVSEPEIGQLVDRLGVDGDKIVVNASASRVAAAVASQLEKLHDTEMIPEGENGVGK